jgi:hypothetical protein
MAIKDSNAFLDDLIQELQVIKEDPEKDTLARVMGMVLRVAKKHNDRTELKRSFITAAMAFDGIDPYEYEVLKRWNDET